MRFPPAVALEARGVGPGRTMRLCLFVVVVLSVASAVVEAQTAVLAPSVLRTVPRGATAAQPFWQRLDIAFDGDPAAGDSLGIDLPDGVGIADTDGDGRHDDEIVLTEDGNSGYRVSPSTHPGRVVLESVGGQAGSVQLHYPIETPAAPGAATAAYGRIDFSDPGARDIPAGTLILTYVDRVDLALGSWAALWAAGADTSGNDLGDRHPAVAAAAFGTELPDLVGDGALVQGGNVPGGGRLGDGRDDNDVGYAFWWSNTDSLIRVDSTTAIRALDADLDVFAAVSEGDTAALSFDTRALSVGTYYLYLTADLTASLPLARSRALTVRHRPAVVQVGDFAGGDDDYLDSGLWLDFDRGTAGGVAAARDRVAVSFLVADLDDSAAVYLFYSTADSLAADTTGVITSGTAPTRQVTGLSGAAHIDSGAVLKAGRHTSLNWNIAPNDSTFVAEGRYYIYAVASDGRDLAVGRSASAYEVRHSPLLRFDVGDADGDRVRTGGAFAQRFYNITWNRDFGINGDRDVDDSAVIDLYYSERADFDGAAALLQAAADSADGTFAIVAGLDEDADGRDDNRFEWDLWGIAGAAVPRADVPQYLYAIVQADTVDRLLRRDDDDGQAQALLFTHDPYLRVDAPAVALEADGRRSFRVAWTARDLDDGGGVWLLLTPAAAAEALGPSSTYGALRGDGLDDWVAHSPDGSAAASTFLPAIGEDEWPVRPARLRRTVDGRAQPLRDGTYAVYVVMDTGGGSEPAAASLARLAPGTVTLNGLGTGGPEEPQEPLLAVLPAERTLTAPGDTAAYVIRPRTGGSEIDLAALFLSVDTLKVRVVDQDSSAPGVQPFRLNPQLPGLALVDTLQAGADSSTVGRWLLDLVYFEQAGSDRFDGDTDLAHFALVSRDSLGSGEIRLENLPGRQSALFRRGVEVSGLAPGPVARYSVVRRGTIAGRVPLQGRLRHAAPITLLLRKYNSVAPLDDSLFVAANDGDSTRAGIQDTTDAEGRFSLAQVPAGDYHLAVQVAGYLDGQYPDLRLGAGDDLDGVNPTFAADGRTDLGLLLGGDVIGYVDTSGALAPDNQIDQLDVDFVVAYFGRQVTPTHAGLRADVDGDSLVWVSDLNLVAANFGGQGTAPVFKKASGPAPRLRLVDEGEGAFRLEAAAGGDLRAYGLRLRFDPNLFDLVAYRGLQPWGASAAYVVRAEAGALVLGGAILGAESGPGADTAVLARLRLENRPGVSAAARLHLEDVEVVTNGGGLLRLAGGNVLPQETALKPNFPNPFNPQTLLPLVLPEAGVAALEVFDVAGQRVRLLHRGFLPAGEHAFAWDGRDAEGRRVSSGAYFVRLRFGQAEMWRKMLLLR